jgi:hypothetical protein
MLILHRIFRIEWARLRCHRPALTGWTLYSLAALFSLSGPWHSSSSCAPWKHGATGPKIGNSEDIFAKIKLPVRRARFAPAIEPKGCTSPARALRPHLPRSAEGAVSFALGDANCLGND